MHCIYPSDRILQNINKHCLLYNKIVFVHVCLLNVVNVCLNWNTGTMVQFVELCLRGGWSGENCYVTHFRRAEVRHITNLRCAIAQLCSLVHWQGTNTSPSKLNYSTNALCQKTNLCNIKITFSLLFCQPHFGFIETRSLLFL